MNDNIVAATISEARGTPDRVQTLERLRDWRTRVHALYDAVQKSLGPQYAFDRSRKQESSEEQVQRAHLNPEEIPKLDILRIEQDGRLVATILPRGLWIIGANGRLDVIVTTKSGGRRLLMLIDHSIPLSGTSDWRIVRPTDRLQQPHFLPERFHEFLE